MSFRLGFPFLPDKNRNVPRWILPLLFLLFAYTAPGSASAQRVLESIHPGTLLDAFPQHPKIWTVKVFRAGNELSLQSVGMTTEGRMLLEVPVPDPEFPEDPSKVLLKNLRISVLDVGSDRRVRDEYEEFVKSTESEENKSRRVNLPGGPAGRLMVTGRETKPRYEIASFVGKRIILMIESRDMTRVEFLQCVAAMDFSKLQNLGLRLPTVFTAMEKITIHTVDRINPRRNNSHIAGFFRTENVSIEPLSADGSQQKEAYELSDPVILDPALASPN